MFVVKTVDDFVGGGFGLWRCFIPPPCTSRVDEGIRVRVTGRRSARAASCQCTASSPQLLAALSIEVLPSIGDLGRMLFRQALLVLRGLPGVVSWLSHEGLTKFEGGLGHKPVPPGAVLRQGSPFR